MLESILHKNGLTYGAHEVLIWNRFARSRSEFIFHDTAAGKTGLGLSTGRLKFIEMGGAPYPQQK